MQTTSPAFTLMDTNICPFCSPQACVQTPKTTLVQVNKIVDADQTVNRTPERYAQTYAANNTIDQHGQNTLGKQCSMSQVIQNVQAHMLTNFMIPRSGNTHYVLSISLVLEYTAYHRNSHLIITSQMPAIFYIAAIYHTATQRIDITPTASSSIHISIRKQNMHPIQDKSSGNARTVASKYLHASGKK